LISERLVSSVVCVSPECRDTATPSTLQFMSGGELHCPRCGRLYCANPAGYLDLMPPSEAEHTSLYVSQEAEFEAKLDYKRIGPPLLGAGVRQRAIRRLLRPAKEDRLIELGCGNGKFLFWNRKQVDWAVGVDPSPLFAQEALATIDLCRADARSLPFKDGAFTAAMSIDVLEHLTLPGIEAYLGEAYRVLSDEGRLFIYSNTREGSRLDFIVRSARRLSRWLGERGILDDTKDRLRKSDHVKAIETFPELESMLERCGFRIEQVTFWNGLFQSIIENLVVKLGESALARARSRDVGSANHPAAEKADNLGEDQLRSQMRSEFGRRGLVYNLMRLLTELMWLDLVLFGTWRAGPYFVLARRVQRG
jgi:ubiquinone/menaquinone biosynthesis C-methylase UbiE